MDKIPNEVIAESQRLVSNITEMIQKSIMNLKQEHRGHVEATFLAAMGSMGAVQILSAMVGKRAEEGTMIHENINPVSTMFAGLLAAKMGTNVEQQSEFTKVLVPFGWTVMFETLEATERLLGRPVGDESLESHLVEFLRKGEKDQSHKFGSAPIASSRMQ